MDTLTVVEDVEVKEIGGRKAAIVTMLGGSKAGTFEKEVAEAAIAAKGRSVRVKLGQQSGKTILEEIEIVLDEAVPGDDNPLDEVDEEPASVVDNADQGGKVEPLPVDADGDPVAEDAEIIATIYHVVTAIHAELKEIREHQALILDRLPKTRAATGAKPRTPAKTKPSAAKPKAKTTTRKPRTAAKKS